MGARAWGAMHDVFRHALRTDRPLRSRARLPSYDEFARHLPLEEHVPDQRLRSSRRGALRWAGLLGFQLAQGWRLGADDRDQQARRVLSAGILRLRLLVARRQ